MDTISIIIPVYNTEKYLRKCIESFLKQSYSDIEILLVDDGSTDSSGSICDEYSNQDKRIRVIHKDNGGPADARNVGIENSSGDLITFFDSDDYADKDYIKYLYDIKIKYNVQISSCAYNVSDENGKVLFTINGNKEEECISKSDYLKRMLIEEGITVSPCFKLFDKELLNDIRFPKGYLFEDNGTTYKIIDKCETKISYGNKALCYYVMRFNSQMRSGFKEKKLEMIELTDEMCDYLELAYPELKNQILRRRIYARFNILRQLDFYNQSTKTIEKEITSYILKNKKFIFFNNVVPFRDKVATFLLCISNKSFFIGWNFYRKMKYGK